MNTYVKYIPNVYLAKCSEPHHKGDVITMTTRHGSEHNVIVFNLIGKKDDHYMYSVVREDGFDHAAWALRRAEKLNHSSLKAAKESNSKYEASKEGHDFLVLGEPIKVGHHSEKRHRALIERNNNRMRKSIELQDKAESFASRADYWKNKAKEINLSMPESIDYFEFKMHEAQIKHQGLKDGSIPKQHSYSLTYAKKDLNEATKKFELAKKLWGN